MGVGLVTVKVDMDSQGYSGAHGGHIAFFVVLVFGGQLFRSLEMPGTRDGGQSWQEIVAR